MPRQVEGMTWLQSTYTIRLNRRHKLIGHVLSGRYKEQLVEGSGNGYPFRSRPGSSARMSKSIGIASRHSTFATSHLHALSRGAFTIRGSSAAVLALLSFRRAR